MVESIRVKAEGFVFSVKKGIALSDFIPCLKLSQESLFARSDVQIAWLEAALERYTEI